MWEGAGTPSASERDQVMWTESASALGERWISSLALGVLMGTTAFI